METVLTVTAKGQVTLRKDVLRHLGVGPGAKLQVELLPDGRAVLRKSAKPGSIDRFIGCLYDPGTTPVSIEEMKEIIADAWAGRR